MSDSVITHEECGCLTCGQRFEDIEHYASHICPDPKRADAKLQRLSSTEIPAAIRERTFFLNLDQALAIDKLRSQRREATAFMPIRDQVLVFPCEKDDRSDSGLIFIPESGQERQSEGIVLAVGKGMIDANNIFVPTVVEAGDRVLFGRYAGTEIVLRGKTCRLMMEREILGVIR